VRILVKESRVLISFSIDEGFNLPILEARLLGVPVIASDILVHREIHQEHINLVENSQNELARKISNFEQLVDVTKATILNTKSREKAHDNFRQFYS
jgi:glycosyltransferase involved in cell wall biosynthesis